MAAVGVQDVEETRIQEFLKRVTAPDHSNNSPVSRNTANKFLMARKFDVNRAILLYDQHQAVRKQEDLIDVDITQTDVKQELLNEKFTILNARDPNGAAIALFTVRFHLPANTSHKATLKALIFQLDAALESSETQRNGLVFIYDMTQSKYINFDYELSIKILTLLKGAYPARLKKVLIVTAPLWFKAPFRILRLFVREKLRDRVYIVNGEQLRQHISSRALPRRLGGQMELNHRQWISKCLQLHWGKQIDNDLAAYFEDMDNTVMPELSIYSLSSSASSPPSSPGDSSPGTQPSSEHGSEGTVPEKHTSEYIEKHLQIGAEDGDILDQNMLMDIVDAERGGDVGLLSVARTSGQGQSQRSSRHSSSGASCDEVTSKSPQSYAQSSRNSTRASLTDSVVDSASQNQQCNRMTASDLGYSWTSEGGTSLCDVKTIPCKRGSDTSPSELGSDGQTVADYIPKRKAPSKFEDSIHKPESGGYSIKEFLDYTRAKGRPGLIQEYEKIKATRPLGTFDSSRLKVNADKNRYTDVPCFEHSRVKLEGKDDYINANFVDGYRHKGAYISTQGPLPRTFEDFWRMVWEHMILLVVMTTRTVERGRIKCGQYWPLEGEVEEFDSFVVTNQGERSHGDYTVTVLLLTNTATGEERQVTHMQFTSWPDYGVPACANAFLDFMHDVRKEQAMRTSQLGDRWEGHPGGPPIVVHCSAGIGRTGTFITMDILTRRLADIGTVDVLRTVERIRSQRAFSIQMPDQYVFIHHALLEHAQRDGLLDKSALSGFTDTGSDSELEDIFPNRTYIRPAPPKDSSIA